MPSPAPIQHPDRLFIGGEWAAPSGATRFDVLNSATEELFVSVAEAQAADMSAAVAAARQAFDHGPWPRMTHAERAGYLRAIAAELALRADDQASTPPSGSEIVTIVLLKVAWMCATPCGTGRRSFFLPDFLSFFTAGAVAAAIGDSPNGRPSGPTS